MAAGAARREGSRDMRSPIGLRIRARRKQIGLAQTALAERAGISPSYLNLIESNRRAVGGGVLLRIAAGLGVAVDDLTGAREQRLAHDLAEVFADPLLAGVAPSEAEAEDLVAAHPRAARAIVQLHRAHGEAVAAAEAYANRLRSDPLLAELLHQVLSRITAVRSGAEILAEVDDLEPAERARFLATINREARAMSDVTRTLIDAFDRERVTHRSSSPTRELDDLIVDERNHFPRLEAAADDLRAGMERHGRFGEALLADLLERQFAVRVERGAQAGDRGAAGGQYRYDAEARLIRFRGSASAATRQFQLARLYGELAAPDVLKAHTVDDRLTTDAARRLAARAFASYLAGALVLPYAPFLALAEARRYDVDFLAQAHSASFEQVAHRFVTLRRKGAEGIPFGFLRSDPAGRLTKQFPLPGLMLPASGHACPLWAIYGAFRTPGEPVRQIVRFADGARHLFVAKTVAKRLSAFREQPFHVSVMLACDILHADRTVYASGLDLSDADADVPVGPACRLCIRRECEHRQEEMPRAEEEGGALHAPFLAGTAGRLGDGR